MLPNVKCTWNLAQVTRASVIGQILRELAMGGFNFPTTGKCTQVKGPLSEQNRLVPGKVLWRNTWWTTVVRNYSSVRSKAARKHFPWRVIFTDTRKVPQDGSWNTSLISRSKKTKSGKMRNTTLPDYWNDFSSELPTFCLCDPKWKFWRALNLISKPPASILHNE